MTSEERGTIFKEAMNALEDCLNVPANEAKSIIDTLFDVPIWRNWYYNHGEDQPLTDGQRKILQMLAGPHTLAIYKALRIQKGLEP